MTSHPDTAIVILAGGSSRRMGGRDKGLLSLNGRPLIAHVIERLASQASILRICTNRHLEQYAEFGLPVFSDRPPLDAGPLGGLLSALESYDEPFVASVPCDTPFLPSDLVAQLHHCLSASDAAAAVADDGEKHHNAVLLVRRAIAPRLRRYLEQGGRSIHGWLASETHVVCRVGRPHDFTNINTPETLAHFEAEGDNNE